MTAPVPQPPVVGPPEVEVLLRNGRTARLRPLTAADEPELLALNARVSARTRLLRYFSVSDRPGDWYVEHLLGRADAHEALVAHVGDRAVAVASFVRLDRDPALAELAMLVDDAHQAEGLGALLLEHLGELARRQGIATLVADVMAENRRMLQLLGDSGFSARSQVSRGVTTVHLDLADRPQLWDAVHRRDVEAERVSLLPLLRPRSVAVVGGHRDGAVAEQVHRLLQDGAFTGTLHRLARGQRLVDLPEPVDLVVVAVPAEHALAVAKDAAAAGAKGMLVLSAGFAEAGAEGVRRQDALLRTCREAGMRLIGPNCLGVVNTDPEVRLNATFCDARPRPGRVALVSQSGAVGIAALRHAERRGAGLSMFVSTGNKADVSGNDLMAYLEADPRTDVVALYLESFGNASKFVKVAAGLGHTKPVVVVKAGRSAAGAKAGGSHTAAATTPDRAVEALFREAGVLRADDLPELFDLLAVLEGAALPAGPRVAIVGNSGGPGVLAADAVSAAGLQLAELGESTTAQLLAVLPAGASVQDPVDTLATVDAEAFEQAVGLVAADAGVDAVVAIYTPLSRGAEKAYASALTRVHAREPGVPLLAVLPGVAFAPGELAGTGAPVPFFEFPEPAVKALGKVQRYAAWRAEGRLPAPPPSMPGARAVAQAVVDQALADDPAQGCWLSPTAAAQVLEAYGIPLAALVEVVDTDAARAAADGLGYPVVLKAAGPDILHKTELGAVVLGLRSADEVGRAFDDLRRRLGRAMTTAVVQRMEPSDGGFELVAGTSVAPATGPLVLVGAGGTLTDVWDDHAVRMPPRDRLAALEQVASLRCARRLAGFRGSPPLDVDAVADVLVRLGALMDDVPAVQELDLNPLLVRESGVSALDVRIRVGPAGEDGHALPTRRLTPPRGGHLI